MQQAGGRLGPQTGQVSVGSVRGQQSSKQTLDQVTLLRTAALRSETIWQRDTEGQVMSADGWQAMLTRQENWDQTQSE